MASYSWWLAILVAPIAAQICMLPIYGYWISYAKVDSLYSTHNANNVQTSLFNYSQIKASSVVFWAISIISSLLCVAANSNQLVSLGQFETTVVCLLSFMFLLFNSTLRRVHTPRSVNSLELVNFTLFCATSSFLLVLSSNLLIAFFALELLGSVTLYAFFVFSGYNISSSAQQSISAVSSCVYQFILNFFGSLFFYSALGALTYFHSSSTIFSASTKIAFGWPLIAQTAIVLALFIKLGTGPWIFYKLSIYKGITVQTVVVYTFIYFGAVLVFTFGLLHSSGFNVWLLFGQVCITIFIICVIIFGANVFQTGNIMLFLSFSSLLNLIFIILQVA